MALYKSDIQAIAHSKHTEVIIIGNGPSAMALSFMLSGYRPFYNGALLSNEYLMQRLQDSMDTSLYEQNLSYLSEGLEGRSNNPVSLLFDHLFHPDADLGMDTPSAIEWKYDESCAIPHVVLGKSKPGGTWQKIDGTMQTISQNTWMELPNVPFKEWLANKNRAQSHTTSVQGRASIADVKDYYTDYVESQGLGKNFCNCHIVTSVTQVYHVRSAVASIDSESGELEPCCSNVRRNHTHCWEVRGYIQDDNAQRNSREVTTKGFGYECIQNYDDGTKDDSKENLEKNEKSNNNCSSCGSGLWNNNLNSPDNCKRKILDQESGEEEDESSATRQGFCFIAPHVVLAVGAYDLPNRLGVDGETLPCVVHSLGDFERRLVELKQKIQTEDISVYSTHLSLSSSTSSNATSAAEETCSSLPSILPISHNLISSPPDPVLVVGAGLSAADCVLTAMEAGLPVIHVFRRPANSASMVFQRLPRAMYPEYHYVHRLMKGVETNDLYTPMAGQAVMEVREKAVLVGSAGSGSPTSNRRKKKSDEKIETLSNLLSKRKGNNQNDKNNNCSELCHSSTNLTWVDVSFVAIMVGSRSDLTFLPQEGRDLGVVRGWPIDSKHNVVDVDPFSYQSNRQPQIFALGPLVGDNFVRFGIGGALGIVNHLTKCSKKEQYK